MYGGQGVQRRFSMGEDLIDQLENRERASSVLRAGRTPLLPQPRQASRCGIPPHCGCEERQSARGAVARHATPARTGMHVYGDPIDHLERSHRHKVDTGSDDDDGGPLDGGGGVTPSPPPGDEGGDKGGDDSGAGGGGGGDGSGAGGGSAGAGGGGGSGGGGAGGGDGSGAGGGGAGDGSGEDGAGADGTGQGYGGSAGMPSPGEDSGYVTYTGDAWDNLFGAPGPPLPPAPAPPSPPPQECYNDCDTTVEEAFNACLNAGGTVDDCLKDAALTRARCYTVCDEETL
jgi:hypothetical protein